MTTLFFLGLVMAQHGNWQDQYKSFAGMPCCGVHDCVVVRARVIGINPTSQNIVIVEVNGALRNIHKHSIYSSEDLQDWACLDALRREVRCLFIAAGS